MLRSQTSNQITFYLIEFVLLFSAVSLGFLADNYRQSLMDRKTEKLYLESLMSDLAQDTLKIDFSVESKLIKDKYFDTLYTILYKSAKPWPTRKLYYMARFLMIREPFYGTEGTMHQLENSGGFNLIRNHKLIREINTYTTAKEKIYQIQVARDLNSIHFKEAAGKVFYAKELAFLFDPVKFKGKPYSLGEPEWDPPLLGNDIELNDFFYWASNDVFIERNTRVLLLNLRVKSKELLGDIEQELTKF
jgi:hypothetical protein